MRAQDIAVKRGFTSIEGFRGLAALSVIGVHGATLFGGLVPRHGYLAVDFFFILSGIVMASSYDARLASGALTLRRFIAMRLIRLMPTIVLATLFAVLVHGAILIAGRGEGVTPFADLRSLGLSAALTLVLVPQPWVDGRNYYPLNGPFWSLGFELLVNIVFAACWRALHGIRLALLLAACAIGIVALTPADGSFAQGFAVEHGWLAACRAGFGFFAGVALVRIESRGPLRSNLAVLAGAAALAALFWAPVTIAYADAVAVLVLLPALAWLAMRFDPAGALARVAEALGKASYPVYALHVPLLLVTLAAMQIAGLRDLAPSAGAAIGFVCAVTAVGYGVDRWLDVPIRAWLKARLARSGAGRSGNKRDGAHFSGDIGAPSA